MLINYLAIEIIARITENVCYNIWIAFSLLCAPHSRQKKSKRHMGHIAHLTSQFKSINTFAKSYDFIITLIWRRNTHHFLFDDWQVLISKPFHFTQGCVVPSLVDIGQMILKKKILNSREMYFCYSLIISLGKRRYPLFVQTLFLHPGMLCTCTKLSWFGPVSRDISSLYFCSFVIISLEKGQLKSPSPKNALCQVFVEIGPGEEDEYAKSF